MKKTYINPEMEIVKLQTMQMLAASIDLSDGTADNIDALAPVDDFDFGDEDNSAFFADDDKFDFEY